jgi:hypothetical protein
LIEHVSSYRASVIDEKKEGVKSMANRLLEKEVKITLSTYGRYIGSNPANYFLFPVTLLLFVASEIVLTFFLRFLANY